MKEGCKICEQWEVHCYWEHFSKEKRFMKTLTGDFLLRLNLPRNFATYFKGNDSKTSVMLKGPSGDTWHVGMIETKGNLCLQNGWKDFVHAHHLGENDTLVFIYEGDYCFSVLMFDASECEKESSYFVKNKCTAKQKMKDQVNNQENLKPDAPSVHEMLSSSTPCVNFTKELSPPKKYQKGEPACSKREGPNLLSPKPEIVETSEPEDQPGEATHLSRKRTKKPLNHLKEKSGKGTPPPKRQPVANAEWDRALHLACAFQPSRPSFLSVLKYYNIYPTGYYLKVHHEFAKKYLPKDNAEISIRLLSGKRDWKVNYRVNRHSCRLASNWRNFTKDNFLKEGDVCVMELLEDQKALLMTAHIFRVSDEAVPLEA